VIVFVEIFVNVFVTALILHEHEHDFPHGLAFKPIHDSVDLPFRY